MIVCISPAPQIAPAEGVDPKQRMVIIAGPPEAQFKVTFLQNQGELVKLVGWLLCGETWWMGSWFQSELFFGS